MHDTDFTSALPFSYWRFCNFSVLPNSMLFDAMTEFIVNIFLQIVAMATESYKETLPLL